MKKKSIEFNAMTKLLVAFNKLLVTNKKHEDHGLFFSFVFEFS